MTTAVGFDFGNTQSKICIENKCSSIPSIYAFDKPIILKTGQEITTNAFSLLFRQWLDKKRETHKDVPFWFGQDVLASQSIIHKLKAAKYDHKHISILFQATLYQWSKRYKIDLKELGKLNVVTSMPPGLYQQKHLYKQALTAYRKTFDRNQSHVKIRDGKDCTQIVTQFGGLIREAIPFGQNLNKNANILILDLGGETNDIAVFNGSPEPIYSKTIHNGLLHTYAKINSVNHRQAELKILKSKTLHQDLMAYYNQMENIIQLINGQIRIDIIYVIGGGAKLMPKSIQQTFKSLASEVYIKDEFVNARTNWQEAKEDTK